MLEWQCWNITRTKTLWNRLFVHFLTKSIEKHTQEKGNQNNDQRP